MDQFAIHFENALKEKQENGINQQLKKKYKIKLPNEIKAKHKLKNKLTEQEIHYRIKQIEYAIKLTKREYNIYKKTVNESSSIKYFQKELLRLRQILYYYKHRDSCLFTTRCVQQFYKEYEPERLKNQYEKRKQRILEMKKNNPIEYEKYLRRKRRTQKKLRARNRATTPFEDRKKIKTTEDFIYKAIKLYGDFYDYSKVKYVNRDTDITIICPKHGEFRKRACVFLNVNCKYRDCNKCRNENNQHD